MTTEDIFYVLREQDMIIVAESQTGSRAPATAKYKSREGGASSSSSRGRRGRPRGGGAANRAAAAHKDKEDALAVPSEYRIHFDRAYVEAILSKYEAKGYLKVRPEKLHWTPFLVTRAFPTPGALPGLIEGSAASWDTFAGAGGHAPTAVAAAKVPATPAPAPVSNGTSSHAVALDPQAPTTSLTTATSAAAAPTPVVQPASLPTTAMGNMSLERAQEQAGGSAPTVDGQVTAAAAPAPEPVELAMLVEPGQPTVLVPASAVEEAQAAPVPPSSGIQDHPQLQVKEDSAPLGGVEMVDVHAPAPDAAHVDAVMKDAGAEGDADADADADAELDVDFEVSIPIVSRTNSASWSAALPPAGVAPGSDGLLDIDAEGEEDDLDADGEDDPEV